MKRFYKTVSVNQGDGRWRIALDGRELRTPGRVALDLPTAPLAEAVAEEWRAQGEKVLPHTMPLTSLAFTAADRVAPLRTGVVEQLLRFAQNDLVCYRAEEPEELVRRQEAGWQPLIEWLEQRFDARLSVVRGILPQTQPESALRAIRAALDAMDDYALTAVSGAAAAGSSIVVALALVEKRLAAAEAFALAQLDELWQAEVWGGDPEAEARRALLAAEFDAAARFHSLSRLSLGPEQGAA